jgi:hypothetical protein
MTSNPAIRNPIPIYMTGSIMSPPEPPQPYLDRMARPAGRFQHVRTLI